MRKLQVLFILSFSLASTIVIAGKKRPNGKYIMQSVYENKATFYQVCRYGGTTPVSPEKFEDYKMYDFNYFCVVKKNGKWGVIDAQARTLIPFEYDYLNYFYRPNGISLFGYEQKAPLDKTPGYFVASLNKRYGVIDNTGKVLVEPLYEEVNMWWNGGVAYAKKDGKWGMLNFEKQVVVPFEYDLPVCAHQQCLLADKDHLIGAFDRKGKVVIPFRYSATDPNGDQTLLKLNSKWGRLDSMGRELLPFEYDSISSTARYQTYLAKKDGKWMLINNADGRIALNSLVYDNVFASPFSEEETFIARAGRSWTLNSLTGKMIAPLVCDTVLLSETPFYVLRKAGKYGIISEKGQVVMPFNYDSLSVDDLNQQEYALRVYQGGKCGVYDYEGRKEILPCRYEDTDPFSVIDNPYGSRFAQVKKDGKDQLCLLDPKFTTLGNAIKVNDFMMMNRTETTIREWLWFCYSRLDGGAFMPADLPDTNALNPLCRIAFRYDPSIENTSWDQVTISPPFINQRVRVYCPKGKAKELENILDYPITGITYQQALEFCHYASGQLAESGYYDGASPEMRLPTEKEWETIARAGLRPEEQPKDAHDSVNTKGCMLFRYKTDNSCPTYAQMLKLRGRETVKGWDFFPDNNGIYNLFGNVAEMVSVQGIAKGGSYIHSAKEAGVGSSLTYNGPLPWVGFRYVFEFRMN
jgi:hypothetical protein